MTDMDSDSVNNINGETVSRGVIVTLHSERVRLCNVVICLSVIHVLCDKTAEARIVCFYFWVKYGKFFRKIYRRSRQPGGSKYGDLQLLWFQSSYNYFIKICVATVYLKKAHYLTFECFNQKSTNFYNFWRQKSWVKYACEVRKFSTSPENCH